MINEILEYDCRNEPQSPEAETLRGGKGFEIETQVDIAGFQGWKLPPDNRITGSYYMSGDADYVANGKTLLSQFLSIGSDAGINEIKTEEGTGHGVANYGKDGYIRQIPKSSRNPSYKIENKRITNQNYVVPSDNTKNNIRRK